MRFVTDRCVQCGTPTRGTISPTKYPHHNYLHADGSWAGTDFWFCSADCYDDAFEGFLPHLYHHGKTAEDDPQFSEEYREVGEWDDTPENYAEARSRMQYRVDDYNGRRRFARTEAHTKLAARLSGEYSALLEKEAEQRRVEEEKQQRREEAERAREEAAREAELARQEAEEAARLEYEEMIAEKEIPPRKRFEHTHILAPSGFGKTTLIQQIILDDLETDDPPGYVVIDPKGELVDRLARLKVFQHDLADRLVVVDPTRHQLPALNMFSFPDDLRGRDRIRVMNQLVDTFSYVFSSADARLTQRQSIPFGYVVKLIFSMGGDIYTLMDILDDNPKEPKFRDAMAKLGEEDEGARRFFERDFYSAGFNETRQQIKTRLYEIISRHELAEMFAAPENRLDIFDCIQRGKIVLVNTALGQLGPKGSTLLGRYFIAMTLNAAFSRFRVPKSQWRPAFLVIDEFQDFADEEKTPELLRLAREYNLGVVLAHQAMTSTELTEPIRSAISTNTSIKYASSPEGIDVGYVARDLRCDPDFFRTHTAPQGGNARFACFVRGMGLQHPFIVNVPFGNVEQWHQLTREEYYHARQELDDDLAPRGLIARAKAASEEAQKRGPVAPQPAPTKPAPAASPRSPQQDASEPGDY